MLRADEQTGFRLLNLRNDSLRSVTVTVTVRVVLLIVDTCLWFSRKFDAIKYDVQKIEVSCNCVLPFAIGSDCSYLMCC